LADSVRQHAERPAAIDALASGQESFLKGAGMQRVIRHLVSMAAGGLLVAVVLVGARAFAQEGAAGAASIASGSVVEQAAGPSQVSIVDGTLAVQRTFTYQGVLLTPANVPVPSGTYNMTFRLYRDNQSLVWQETQAVVVADGFFSARLGAVTPLSVDTFVDAQLFLGVQVNNDAEMAPRQPLSQVPYAFAAERLNQFRSYGVVNADGSKRKGFRFESQRTGQGIYLIDVKENYQLGEYVTNVTPLSNNSNPDCQRAVAPLTNSSNGRLLVELFGPNGRVDCAFHFSTLDLPD
jgi:hypothetical protein